MIRQVAAACVLLAVLYAASFFAIRFRAPTPSFDPEQKGVVVFSYDPDTQEAALAFYRPLIVFFPGRNWYPSGRQITIINDFNEKTRAWNGDGEEIISE